MMRPGRGSWRHLYAAARSTLVGSMLLASSDRHRAVVQLPARRSAERFSGAHATEDAAV